MAIPEVQALFGALSRDVWVVTSREGPSRGGLLVTWLLPFSLAGDKPSVVVGLSPSSHTAGLVDRSGAFAAHLLAPGQAARALPFALTSGADVPDKLSDWRVTESASGSPRLLDCQGWLDCRVFARQDVGSRILYWGDVIDAQAPPRGVELLSEHQLLAAATADQKTQLRDDRDASAKRHASADQLWRESMRPM